MSLMDLLKEKKQALAAGKRGRTVKPPPNRSMWRILPSWKGADQQFWQDFGQHFIKDAGGNILAIYVDTEKTFGRPSELNALIGQAIKSCTDDATMQLLKDAKSSGSVLLNALQTDSPNPTKVEILEIRPSVFEQIITLAQEYEEAGESIFDVTKGREIIILREGTGLNTKYTVQAAVKNRVVSVPPEVMKQLNDLEAYVAQESAEGSFRALNAVKSIAGLLPAAGSGPAGLGVSGIPTARLPSSAVAAATIEDDYAAAPPPGKGATPSVEFDDVPELVAAPAPAAAPAVAPAAAPVAAAAVESTGDPELDKLLAGL
ncbi:DNA binding protein like protein [compost metagenome]